MLNLSISTENSGKKLCVCVCVFFFFLLDLDTSQDSKWTKGSGVVFVSFQLYWDKEME